MMSIEDNQRLKFYPKNVAKIESCSKSLLFPHVKRQKCHILELIITYFIQVPNNIILSMCISYNHRVVILCLIKQSNQYK